MEAPAAAGAAPAAPPPAEEQEDEGVSVTLPKNYLASHGATILQELIKFCLYSRSQIPFPYDQLREAVQEMRVEAGGAEEEGEEGGASSRPRRKRPSLAQRRIEKFVATVDGLLGMLGPAVFESGRATQALVLLGPSPSRPKEVYHVALPADAPHSPAAGGAGGRDPAAAADFDRRVRAEGAKRLLRALVSASGRSLPDGGAAKGPTKLHVLVSADAGAGTPPGFLPKRGFQLNMRRGKLRPASIRLTRPGAGDGGGGGGAAGAGGGGGGAGDHIWFLCSVAIKGIKGSDNG